MATGRHSEGAVLIPTARQMKSYACMRSLAQRGVRTVVASEHERIPHFASRYCSEQVQLSAAPEELTAYRDALLDIAARSDVETILPIRECDTYLFAKYRDRFEKYVSLVTPDLDTLEKAQDRILLSEEARRAGVPQARTRRLSDVDQWDSDVVIKSRYNLLTSDYVDSLSADDAAESRSVRFLQAGEEPDPAAIRAEMAHDPIVQDYIHESDRYLYCGLWDHGEPLASSQHKQIRSNSWVGGGAVYRVSAYSQEVERVATRLLSQLDWHGLVCAEYARDEETGEWKFLELNPRIWQSLPAATRAGADFPYYYWLRAQGRPEAIDPTYDIGVGTHMAYGELSHLLSIRTDDSPFLDRPAFGKTLLNIATSCVVDPRFDNIRLDDPQFFANAIRNALSSDDSGGRQYVAGTATDEPPA
jgi:predicted ATP-grasp superfamily ATP-dependent carboligase